MTTSGLKKLVFFLCACVIGFCGRCAIYEVTTTADSGPGSLREAMLDAMFKRKATIVFTNIFGTISLQSALPDISANLTILGNGSTNVAINGYRTNRIFNILSGAVCNISDLSLQGGSPLPFSSYPTTSVSWAIYNAGALSISNCIIHDNGSGSPGSLQLGGGAVYSAGDSLVLNNVVFSNNATYGLSALLASNVRATNCLFIKNQSGDRPPIDVGNSVFSDTIFTGNAAWYATGGGGIAGGGDLTLLNCYITNNIGDFEAGGILFNGNNLMISNCVVSGNSAGHHTGGIEASGSNIVILKSSISENEADGIRGGMTLDGNAYLSGCTISLNTTLLDDSGIANFGTLTMTNCTISGNASEWYPGAGIGNYGTAQVVNCTIANNGDGVANYGTFYALNTLIANNESDDFFGTLTSQGYNLIGVLTTNTTIVGSTNGNIYGADPLLGPLQNNGGPTLTHALLNGSPAIDAGTIAGAPLTDQRGVARPYGGVVDIGAFEFENSSLAVNTAPRITSIARINSSDIYLRVEGRFGAVCTIQASSNLVDWENVFVSGKAAVGTGAWEFADQEAANYPNRFYRAFTN
jgi:hypothetical protein